MMDELLINLVANAPIMIGLVALIIEVRNSRDDWRRRYDELLEYVLETTDVTIAEVSRIHNGK